MVSASERNYFGNVQRLMESGVPPDEAMQMCAEMEKMIGGAFMLEYYPGEMGVVREGRPSRKNQSKGRKPKPKREYTAKSKRWLNIEI